MGTRHGQRPRRQNATSKRTRERIVAAVRDLLSEGKFHDATVEEVATRAGVARATLYQHFHSRFGLVDAICDTFDENPALVAIRDSARNAEPVAALESSIENTVRFWASEEAILAPLYGAAAIDPAARDLVDRQRADRRSEFALMLRRLGDAGRLRAGLNTRHALGVLLMLTSFETFEELRRHAGLSERDVTGTLQDSVRRLLLGEPTPLSPRVLGAPPRRMR